MLTATAALAQDAPKAQPKPPAADPVIVTAGSIQIHQSEFEQAVKSLPEQYRAQALSTGKKQFADDYLRMKLLAAEGMKQNLQNDPEITKQMNLMRENLVATAAAKKLESSIQVTDAELQKFYNDNKKDFEQVTARHILVAFKGSPAAQAGKPELTEEQAKAKADALYKQIVAGADFAELAKKESDDVGSGSKGGDLGAFGHGQMVTEFEKVAFETKPGEVAPVVRTQFGYHIIKVDKHDMVPLESVKTTLERNLRRKKMQEALDALKDNAKPVYDSTYFAAAGSDGSHP